MSQRAYARHRNMNVSAVQTAIHAGRIETLPDGRIDSDVADEQWERNTREHAPRSDARKAREHDGDTDVFGLSQYKKARAVEAHFRARLTQLQYEKEIGKLISADEVKVTAFNTGRQYRDHILAIPDRIAPILAAESNATTCHEILTTELRRALNDFADQR